MEFGKRHDTTDRPTSYKGLLPAPINLLRTCYGETGVMDFGIYSVLASLPFSVPDQRKSP